MINKIIIFIICLKLRVKPFERFQFNNQKSKYDMYYFTKYRLMKLSYDDHKGQYHETIYSNVSLNWLLDSECRIKKVEA